MANRPDPKVVGVHTAQPGDVSGRPEDAATGADDMAYGEPNGPRPPTIERLPKDEIERRAAGGGSSNPDPDGRRTATEPETDGFFGGGGSDGPDARHLEEHPKVVHDPTGRNESA